MTTATATVRISIVIPTLDEAASLGRLLRALSVETTAHEVVVVDGGSGDATVEIARDAGVAVLSSPPGRGRQLCRGIAAARGDILLFLHADSGFPDGGLARICDVLDNDQGLVGGNFQVLFDGGDGFSRWLTGFYAWFRSHGLYYGDSAVFVRRGVYDRIGGLRPLALLEDFEFTRRLESAGRTCCLDGPPLVTSSRRFENCHPVAIVCGWLWIHALYYLRVSPDRLARIYDSERRRHRDHRKEARK